MNKMYNALLMTIIIEVALKMFTSEEITPTPLYDWVIDPGQWTITTFLGTWILPSLTLLTAGGIIVGSFFNRTDWIFRLALVATWITFGAVLAHLWVYIYSVIPGDAKVIVAFISVFPLLLYYFMASIDYISVPS